MKIYTSRPKNTAARRAWDYFCSIRNKSPNAIFYSRDNIDGPRWVADFGFDPSLATLTPNGFMGGSDIVDIETSELERRLK